MRLVKATKDMYAKIPGMETAPYITVKDDQDLDRRMYKCVPAPAYTPRTPVNSESEVGTWLVYWIYHTTGLHIAIGNFLTRRSAIANAYLAAMDYIDSCDDPRSYTLHPVDYLEGGEDMYIDVLDKEGENEMTVYMLKILN